MTRLTEIYGAVYGGEVVDRLSLARELAEVYGLQLRGDEQIAGQLDLTLALARRLEQQMTAMKMGKCCRGCASRPGGGCCSAFMANENDALQLLMNLLAGVAVHLVRDDQIECGFLGLRGCILPLKPLFCLNYNCTQIKTMFHANELAHLEQRTGDLLRAQVVLEQLLIDFLHHQ